MDSPFRRIVCGVDGSRSATEAVRQARALAGRNTAVELVVVIDDAGHVLGAGSLSRQEAERYLAEAYELFAGSPAEVATSIVGGSQPWKRLLERAADCDLLVVGRQRSSRAVGITFATTLSSVVHHARIPVLVAAEPPAGASFPGRIMVAADGPGHPEDAVRLAGQIGRHTGTGDISLLRVDWSRRAKLPKLAEAVAYVREVTGDEPEEILIGGTPHRLIPEYAARENASLVLMGTRGLSGVHALRSVSERVAHEAPCSVLIVHSAHDDAEHRIERAGDPVSS
jgi:nucleotide-binding universal stress UspA family protein